MSWQLACFAVLGAMLIAGFAWYEHSRPPSQIVALVAALAALAVAGRIALAPIPNVVATTDVVIFAGYALGGAPGFVVGALAGVVSNFWLGQGPWTPWQMAAWGVMGVLGALLCRATGGRANRFVLAAACGLAGVAFGAIMNFSLMASYGGDLTGERFLALEARAVPFDAAHAIGNITLALIAGPAMVRMLVRFRQRFEWQRSATVIATAGLALMLALVPLARPAPARAADVVGAAGWLRGTQNDDGGFPETPGRDSSVAMTGWAMLGLEAAAINPLDVSSAGETPVDFLRANVGDIRSTGDIARTVLALQAAGVDVRDFGGRNLLEEIRDRKAQNGSWEGWPNSTAFAVMALRAGGAPKGLDNSLAWLRDVQAGDGGWGDVARSPSNADSTGAVLQVVQGSRSADNGVTYLRRHQVQGGGYRLGSGGVINSQSTAWAVQGLIASGVDPANVKAGGKSALDYLDARQDPDGHFRYSKSSDVTPVWVTGQVLVAVSGESYPLPEVPRQPEAPDTNTSTPSLPPSSLSPPPPETFDFGNSSGSGSNGSGGGSGDGAPSPGAGLGSNSPSIGPVGPGGDTGSGAPEGEGDGSGATQVSEGELASAKGTEGPAPLPPIAIGLATGLAALVGTWYIGRRRVW